MNNSVEKSKERHRTHESREGYWSGAFDSAHDDTKRHFEMLKTALPVLKNINPKSILTIGDNRGRDAHFFKSTLGCHSTASDLDISKLLPAKNDGYISDCLVVDVENIPLEDNSVDVVIAKESFHHWPRPMMGFYEMLRVAKFGIILIEPNDCFNGQVSPQLTTDGYADHYEDVGNYKYQISVREILKSCWSLYIDRAFVKGFNDPYTNNFNFSEWMLEKQKLDELGDNGKRQFNLVTIYVEKNDIGIDTSELENYYTIYTRPKNPFIE